ncbi:hypothetical protein A5642_09655 [Mycolicibacterium mucogenicum]|uniref:LGFP repeat-containing protein n=1 Tax=Mycolicibacterium mucogenicum TaxID=56689 RepID=A0A1A0N2V4_MYCMU|nr:hypothetical protein [Mycolicibacterium mucogenicum]OBA91947.1 hypothetical protein A5642_09655 [Mycolicibacterium mucogenicum]TXH17986.1 MAG: hypothetical protein E6R06_27580 [Mycobacterium sp.]
MTGLRTRGGWAGVGALSVAVALLMAPTAYATPESDADAAISHTWDAAGGDTGELGAKDGDVYQVGAGFAQNFAGGKIYFSEGTGAHLIYGAILDKYQALGGAADSDLGFPTIDEGAGKATDSRNSTFSAADKPVIFWTPDNGAWVVRGAINAAWDKLGGSAGTLGVPTADESWKGDVVTQPFTGGEVSWNAKTKAFTTTPADLAGQLTGLDVPGDATTAIAAARRAAGGPQGTLGDEQGAQYKVGDGVAQNFAGGTIFYSPATGAHAITGDVLAKYRAAGGPQGDLGFPASNETDGGISPTSRIATFAAADNPAIFWTPEHGAFVVRGAMNAAWDKLGGATGKLGAPTADQTVSGDVVSQKFTGGSISWNKSSRAFSTEPAELASQLGGLQVPTVDLPGGVTSQSDEAGKWYQFHWWWLLAIIPLLLVVVGIVIASLLRRRRHAGPDAVDDQDAYDYDDHEFGDGEYGDPQYADGGVDSEYGDEFAAEDQQFDGPHGGPAFQSNPDVIDTAPTVYPDFTAEQPADEPVDGEADADADAEAQAELDAEPVDAAEPYEPEPQASDDDGDREPADEPTASVQLPDALRRGGTAAGLTAAGLAGFAGLRPRNPSDRVWAAPAEDQDTEDQADERAPEPEPEEQVAEAEAPAVSEAEQPSAEAPVDEAPAEDTVAAGPASGRHHALGAEEPETAQMSFRVATGAEPPEGYGIKANTESGLYWVPGSPGYDEAPVQIWFASEEFAVTNGFIRG